MRSKSFGTLEHACLRIVLLAAFVGASYIGTSARAQTIAGHAIGEDGSKLLADQQAHASTPAGEYTTIELANPTSINLKATYDNGSKKVIQLEASRRLQPGSSGQFGHFEFGKTSLFDIRSHFGSKGLLFAGVVPVTSTPDGGVSIVTSYEVRGTNVIASFISKISSASLGDLKKRYGDDMYAHIDTVAVLESTIVAESDYLKLTRGHELVYDTGYVPIVWEAPILPAVGRQFSLARISPSQLPVHRIYNGPINAPFFADASARNFQTRISEGMAGGPNFAGEYAVIQVGCGTGCSLAFVASVRTGEVSRVPLDEEAAQYLDLKYQIDSRLMIAQTARGEAMKCHIRFLTMDGAEWISLLDYDIGPKESCYNSIAQNLGN
jgi:hypothetical protein